MYGELAKTALEFLKLLPRYLVAITIICSVPLFAGETILQTLGLSQFAEDYRQWLGMTFVVCLVLFAVDRSIEISRIVRNRTKIKKLRERRLQRLHSLTEEEKQILRFYIAKQTRTNVLSVTDGVVQGLVAAGIIVRAANIGSSNFKFAHNIAEWAWEYLQEHHEVLAGTTDVYRSCSKKVSWHEFPEDI